MEAQTCTLSLFCCGNQLSAIVTLKREKRKLPRHSKVPGLKNVYDNSSRSNVAKIQGLSEFGMTRFYVDLVLVTSISDPQAFEFFLCAHTDEWVIKMFS